ncbi:hypothetical protein [Reinekea sp.]|jgi:hypothetical protein|uniref:hypothetical protein n=1 Tax=Reinekea sp. TaxID=1970455 RepID=UPI002A815286|nr:hypothetical protein [Reinekea sp.]
MSHSDLRPQIRVDNRTVQASQASAAGTYTIHWLDNEDRAKKIEFYADLSLYKILYPDLLLPLQLQVSEHQCNHPMVACECHSLRQKIAENSYKFDISRFDAAGKLTTRTACIEDAQGHLLTTTTFSADGAFVVRSNYHYDNGMTLESVQDYDSFGNLISA